MLCWQVIVVIAAISSGAITQVVISNGEFNLSTFNKK